MAGRLVLVQGSESANSQTSEKGATKNGQEVANVHCHDGQHTVESISKIVTTSDTFMKTSNKLTEGIRCLQ